MADRLATAGSQQASLVGFVSRPQKQDVLFSTSMVAHFIPYCHLQMRPVEHVFLDSRKRKLLKKDQKLTKGARRRRHYDPLVLKALIVDIMEDHCPLRIAT